MANGVMAISKIGGYWLRKECSSTDVTQVISVITHGFQRSLAHITQQNNNPTKEEESCKY